jgi:predicted dehydrogenase
MDAIFPSVEWPALAHPEPRLIEFPSRPVVRLGVIGGSLKSAVGRTHFFAAQMGGAFRINAGCFSRDTVENARTAEYLRLPMSSVFDSPSALIESANKQIDAILILTPTPDHPNHIRLAMEAGLPVISEKALTTNIGDCVDLRKIQATTKKSLSITYNYSGYPFVREMRARVLRGDLGRILKAVIEMPQEGFLRQGLNGQALVPQAWRLVDGEIPTVSLDLGVHCHHLLRFLTDQSLAATWSREASLGNFPQVIDDVECAGTLGRDGQFFMWFGKAALGHRNGLRIRLYGSEGSADWYQSIPDELHLNTRSGQSYRLDFGSPDLLVSNQVRYMRFKAGHPTGFIEAFANLYDDLAGHITGIPMPRSDRSYVPSIDEAELGLRFLHDVHTLSSTVT